MPSLKMHADEVDTDPSLVRRLLAAQFPQWGELPLQPVNSAGTDNAIYRLGDELSVRLPRIHWAVDQVEKEHRWMPRLAPHLPLTIPQPLALGDPAHGYPYRWSIYRWLSGQNRTLDQITDPRRAALDLAHFLLALQQIDTTGGPLAAEHGLRGVPLAPRDDAVRENIAALRNLNLLDDREVGTALAAWENALAAPDWNHAPIWFHGDLLPGNLLFEQDRLSAVIDFGGLGVGDPAPDLMIAWALFAGESRAAFRETLGVDDATWARGRGHALAQAVIFIPYYVETNPVGVGYARRSLAAVLGDFRAAE